MLVQVAVILLKIRQFFKLSYIGHILASDVKRTALMMVLVLLLAAATR